MREVSRVVWGGEVLVNPYGEIPEGVSCSRCEHPATLKFYEGNPSGLDIAHGAVPVPLCSCCYNKGALAYAEGKIREQAERLPKLREQLGRPCGEMELG